MNISDTRIPKVHEKEQHTIEVGKDSAPVGI